MPSFLHEALVRLITEQPALIVPLLAAQHIDVPEFDSITLVSSDLGDLDAAERRADAVIEFRDADGALVLALVFEVQLHRDPVKRFTWPAYLANLHARLRCPVELVVLTTSESVAAWADAPIPLGRGFIHPIVLGPNAVPRVDPADARRLPELAVLSAVARGAIGDEADAVAAALVAIDALPAVDDARALVYLDLIHVALNDAARDALERHMQTKGYEFQSEFAQKYFRAGQQEGQLEGRAEGRVEALLMQLRLKFGDLSPDTIQRVRDASRADVDRWTQQVLTATTLADSLR